MKCPQCYKNNEDHAAYCGHCGHSLVRPEKPRAYAHTTLSRGAGYLNDHARGKSENSRAKTEINGGRWFWMCSILTIIFAFLKLNPGGNFTTGIVDWPWFSLWRASVFVPFVYGIYSFIALLVIVICVIVLAKGINKGIA